MRRAERIEAAAALWLTRREQPEWSSSDQTAFDAWLEESMAHKAAYWRLEHGWREADRIGALGRDTLIDSSIYIAPMRRRGALAAAAVLVALVVTSIFVFGPKRADPVTVAARFATPVGGREVVPLVDGSNVELNTASVVRASITDRDREVWLDRGEAYFEVAHLSGRPFVVHAGSRTVTVLGTKFSVRRDGDKVTVSVIEGRVRIDDAQQPDAVPTAIITSGDVAVASGSSTLLVGKSEERVKASLGWRSGVLHFDDISLSSAVAEFNRYNRTQIEIDDPSTGEIRIGGTFQASNVDAFVRLLHEAYGLRVESQGNIVKIYN